MLLWMNLIGVKINKYLGRIKRCCMMMELVSLFWLFWLCYNGEEYYEVSLHLPTNT